MTKSMSLNLIRNNYYRYRFIQLVLFLQIKKDLNNLAEFLGILYLILIKYINPNRPRQFKVNCS